MRRLTDNERETLLNHFMSDCAYGYTVENIKLCSYPIADIDINLLTECKVCTEIDFCEECSQFEHRQTVQRVDSEEEQFTLDLPDIEDILEDPKEIRDAYLCIARH